MTLNDMIRLVKSLSASEKRQLRLAANKQQGSKDYMQLLTIINQYPRELIKAKFHSACPDSSLVNTTQYLGKVILRCLVDVKKENDSLFQRLQDVMELKVLQERSLSQEALHRIRKMRAAVIASQQPWLEYLTYRSELDYYADNNFPDITDDALISLQMKGRETIKTLNHIQEHHSLFEMLKYRLIYSGKINSDEEKKKMSDLMLSEMTLVTSKTKQHFVTQKLHLLFQASFFTNTGEYNTALATLNNLNELFEKHFHLWEYPPMDYLSSLSSIMDSLLALHKTSEIGFYLNKTKQLDDAKYPEYFRIQVKKIVNVYELAILISEKKLEEAEGYVQELHPTVMKMMNLVSEEKQWELYFYCSLIYVKLKKWKKAHQYILGIMQLEKAEPHLLICRAVRLLNLVVYYEQGETDYLEYEVRSYKRFIAKNSTRFKIEKLLLKYIGAYPGKKLIVSTKDKKLIQQEVEKIKLDKYENQLLKYF